MALDPCQTHELTRAVIGAAIEVHRHLGPGLLESAYQRCLAREMWLRGLNFREQVSLPLVFKGLALPSSFRVDFLVEDLLIVEVKSVEGVLPIHEAQVITYLRLTNLRTALLINFNVTLLRSGLRRLLKPSAPLRSLRSSL